jgi:hypothetical protein
VKPKVMSFRERRWPEVKDGGIAGAGARIGVRCRRWERVERDEERLEERAHVVGPACAGHGDLAVG